MNQRSFFKLSGFQTTLLHLYFRLQKDLAPEFCSRLMSFIVKSI